MTPFQIAHPACDDSPRELQNDDVTPTIYIELIAVLSDSVVLRVHSN